MTVSWSPIDLRSDTVTQATPEMRRAMAEAVVGDAMIGEDPTVSELESRLCSFFGFSFAAFVPSGTMSNQIVLRALTEPGDAVLAPADNHIVQFESGALAALAGLQLIAADGDSLAPHIINEEGVTERVTAPSEFFRPPLRLVAIENTALSSAGAVYEKKRILRLSEVCRSHGLKLHLDGARIWHALDPAAHEARWLGESLDGLSVCFSKGLGAPVGSVALVHRPEDAQRLKRFQKMYGGCMRQAGHLAAAAQVGFEKQWPRLGETHAMARAFVQALGASPLAMVRGARVEWGGTNVVFLHTSSAADSAALVKTANEQWGMRLSIFRPKVVRAVFHLDVDPAAYEAALKRI